MEQKIKEIIEFVKDKGLEKKDTDQLEKLLKCIFDYEYEKFKNFSIIEILNNVSYEYCKNCEKLTHKYDKRNCFICHDSRCCKYCKKFLFLPFLNTEECMTDKLGHYYCESHDNFLKENNINNVKEYRYSKFPKKCNNF